MSSEKWAEKLSRIWVVGLLAVSIVALEGKTTRAELGVGQTLEQTVSVEPRPSYIETLNSRAARIAKIDKGEQSLAETAETVWRNITSHMVWENGMKPGQEAVVDSLSAIASGGKSMATVLGYDQNADIATWYFVSAKKDAISGSELPMNIEGQAIAAIAPVGVDENGVPVVIISMADATVASGSGLKMGKVKMIDGKYQYDGLMEVTPGYNLSFEQHDYPDDYIPPMVYEVEPEHYLLAYTAKAFQAGTSSYYTRLVDVNLKTRQTRLANLREAVGSTANIRQLSSEVVNKGNGEYGVTLVNATDPNSNWGEILGVEILINPKEFVVKSTEIYRDVGDVNQTAVLGDEVYALQASGRLLSKAKLPSESPYQSLRDLGADEWTGLTIGRVMQGENTSFAIRAVGPKGAQFLRVSGDGTMQPGGGLSGYARGGSTSEVDQMWLYYRQKTSGLSVDLVNYGVCETFLPSALTTR